TSKLYRQRRKKQYAKPPPIKSINDKKPLHQYYKTVYPKAYVPGVRGRLFERLGNGSFSPAMSCRNRCLSLSKAMLPSPV
ncbi:MAG: hypothetical protein JXB48_08130, partial [Candidatus Latescibacteria bacterium]|nr:hypothetical protein [Candidatus Latescibacterota bacterium]